MAAHDLLVAVGVAVSQLAARACRLNVLAATDAGYLARIHEPAAPRGGGAVCRQSFWRYAPKTLPVSTGAPAGAPQGSPEPHAAQPALAQPDVKPER